MAQSAKKQVLEEEEYVEALDKIIERDFFPDLQKLKDHSLWLDALASNNPRLIQEVRQHLLQQKKAQDAPRSSSNPEAKRKHRTPLPTASSSWDQPTPPRESTDDFDSPERQDDRPPSEPTNEATKLTLNHFIALHTSEDNAAFEELQEKAIKDHKRKYHWAYEDTDGRGDSKLLLLKDGTWMTKEQRQLMDKACDTKLALEDKRPVAPDTWAFRARNPLLFPPDLDTNRKICKVQEPTDQLLLLENGSSTTSTTSTAVVSKSRTGAAPKKPMETVYSNSRFSSAFLSTQDAISDQDDAVPQPPSAEFKKDLVAMTPLLVPGQDASPLVTWGAIEATPMILRGETPIRPSSSGPTFVIKESSAREKLAHQMDARNKQRMKARQTPTPLFSKNYTPTPLKSALRTPSVFGGDMQLRASYSTPMRPRVPRPPSSKK
ncbi:hypothetical protein Ae201684P_002981 [Aphanomyces euteiches]|uniref:Nuclear protein Es2 n=1 Tax=Aphanomyces euteiches TaxID=100861 RepID=A0A6G0X2D6_9STRA|nr:hypothetical protein Ae201684_009229 [Aphanomyces euteiches]KAH9070625.1 hypothetical protein Ae201684P_002981 [Aphanomyces euteiches]KAH9133157.1 hypothetical protein AeRB84_020711 [Aphanomyces euteiches]